MSTLDMPQAVFVCKVCGAREVDAIFCDHSPDGCEIEPTLTYADFQEYITAVSLTVHPMPSDAEVWDYLESHTDTAATNREAIDNAIRAVGRAKAQR
jgi:hypothetical protein